MIYETVQNLVTEKFEATSAYAETAFDNAIYIWHKNRQYGLDSGR